MIQLSSAGKRYGHKLLFEDADWLITPESRIGLVGANGTGKSTVMKVLAGMRIARLRHDLARQRHLHRLPSAGRPDDDRPHDFRRVHVGV